MKIHGTSSYATFSHLAHHRGQLTVYLRLNGARYLLFMGRQQMKGDSELSAFATMRVMSSCWPLGLCCNFFDKRGSQLLGGKIFPHSTASIKRSSPSSSPASLKIQSRRQCRDKGVMDTICARHIAINPEKTQHRAGGRVPRDESLQSNPGRCPQLA